MPSCAHVIKKIQDLVISRRCFAEDVKEMYQNVKCNVKPTFSFFELNLLFCGVLVAISVLVAKASFYLDDGNSEFPSL